MTPGHSHSLKIPALRPVSSNPVATDWKRAFYPLFIILLSVPTWDGRAECGSDGMEGVCPLGPRGSRGMSRAELPTFKIFIQNNSTLWDTKSLMKTWKQNDSSSFFGMQQISIRSKISHENTWTEWLKEAHPNCHSLHALFKDCRIRLHISNVT